ncbi:MAG TPA: hypothetical protein VEF03_02685 [Candidatus Binataceae bacterium]|nr:hypothetical protein [Candidatus Binataceae bacterium]
MAGYYLYRYLRLIHIYGAIILVGGIIFNTMVLMPSLRRIPPAHSAVIAEKEGAGLMRLGGTAIVLLGVTGFARAALFHQLGAIFSRQIFVDPHARWVALMAFAWFILAVTGTLSGVWYSTILTKKLPYSAGLRDLEERRASQEWVSAWQDRLAYINLALALIAALGGIMASF